MKKISIFIISIIFILSSSVYAGIYPNYNNYDDINSDSTGMDIDSVDIANDTTYLYVKVNLTVTYADWHHYGVYIDTDNNTSTGGSSNADDYPLDVGPTGMGAEWYIRAEAAGGPVNYIRRQWTGTWTDPGAGSTTTTFSSTTVEHKIPLSDIGNPSIGSTIGIKVINTANGWGTDECDDNGELSYLMAGLNVTVVSSTPTNNSMYGTGETTIIIVFNTNMNAESVRTNSTIIGSGVSGFSASSGNDTKTIVLTINGTLQDGQTYTITIGSNSASIGGTLLDEDYQFSFTATANTVWVVSTTPADGGTCDINQTSIVVDFNSNMNAALVEANSSISGSGVSGFSSSSGNNTTAITLFINGTLQNGQIYTVTIGSNSASMGGSTLGTNYQFFFTGKNCSGDFYVDGVSGNDGNDGSIGAPFKTISKAAETVCAGATVYVRSGTYNEQVDIYTSGTATDPIVFRNYPGETVLLQNSGITDHAFNITGADYIRIKGFEIQNYKKSGIYLYDANNCIISSNTCHGHNSTSITNIAGIKAERVTNTKIEMNYCYNNNYGIFLALSSQNPIRFNICNHNQGTAFGSGIHLESSAGNYIIENLCATNNYAGIEFRNGSVWNLAMKNITYDQIGEPNTGQGFGIVAIGDGVNQSDPLNNKNNQFINNSSFHEGESTSWPWGFHAAAWSSEGTRFLNLVSTNKYDAMGCENGFATPKAEYCYGYYMHFWGLDQAASIASSNLVPQYYDRNNRDFKLLPSSRSYRSGRPNPTAPCRGAYTAFVEPVDPFLNTVTSYTMGFMTSYTLGSIPADGEIWVKFPAGFDVSSASFGSASSGWASGAGTFSTTVAGQWIKINRNNDGNATIDGQTTVFTIDNIKNPSTPGIYTIEYKTYNNNGEILDWEKSNYFRILNTGPFYVHSSLGDDFTGQGTKTSPFKTVQKALTRMNFNTINTCYIEGVFNTQLEISNIYGTPSNPIVLTKWSNDWQIQGSSYGITFSVNDVQNIVLEHLIIDSPVNYGIHIQKEISNISFVSSTIKGSSDRGVFFNTGSDNSDNIRFIDTTIQEFNYPIFTSVPLGKLSIEDSVIKNSANYCMYVAGNVDKLIIRNSEIKSNQNGLYIPTSGNTIQNLIITNSLIINNGNYGVISQGTVNGGVIESCYFSNHTQRGIQSVTLNNFLIKSNIMVDNGAYTLYFGATSGLKIIKNRIKGSSSSATYFGSSTPNLIFQSNILVNNGTYGFYSANTGSFVDAFKRNVIVGNTSYAILMGQNFTSFTMRNNTIDVPGNYGTYLRSSGTINFRNNILIKSGGTAGTGLTVGAGTITNAYNDIYNFTTLYSGTTAGTGALSTDPIFVDTLPSNWLSTNYYHLDNSGPCIDAGDPGDDALPEVYGAHIDIGAYENTNAVFSLVRVSTSNTLISSFYGNKKVPGSRLRFTIKYDNDSSVQANNSISEVILSSNFTYVSNSASQNNAFHIGAGSVTVEVFNGSSWIADDGNYNPQTIKKIRWIFSNPIGSNDNSEGNDTPSSVDGEFPDSDAGILRYDVIIK